MNARAQSKRSAVDLIVIFIFLNSLGFPGNYSRLLGGWFRTVIDYSSFLLMIGAMLLTSGERIMDILVIDLRRKYWSIYLFAAVLFVSSMLVSISPSLQIITCIRVTVTAAFALWLCNQFSLRAVLERLYYAQIIFIALTLIFVGLFPGYVHRESAAYAADFVGIYSAKNGAGSELAFGILVQLVLLRIYGEKHIVPSTIFVVTLSLQLILLVLTHNVSSMLCLFVAGMYLLVLQKRSPLFSRLPLGWLYIAGSIGFLVLAMTILPLFSPLFELFGKDATLTGRVPLWEAALSLIMQSHTLCGYGYAMFWRDPYAVDLLHSFFEANSFMARQLSGTHNVLVEMLLNSGVLGVGAFFLSMLVSMSNIRALDEERYLWCSAFILFFMLFGFTERAFATHEFMTMFLFFTLGAACCREEESRARIRGR
ncbi:MAG: O-antigen ligase family protein [Clostridia bacterium]|nr:O-antigen ligase family protein [Clostridia bacterium]